MRDERVKKQATRDGPFSSLRESFKKAVRKNPFASSRTAKKDAVDDVLNSEAFLNKKVEMLKKQIATTQQSIAEVEAEGQKQWEEWGPQVRRFQCGALWHPSLVSYVFLGYQAFHPPAYISPSWGEVILLLGAINPSILDG